MSFFVPERDFSFTVFFFMSIASDEPSFVEQFTLVPRALAWAARTRDARTMNTFMRASIGFCFSGMEINAARHFLPDDHFRPLDVLLNVLERRPFPLLED